MIKTDEEIIKRMQEIKKNYENFNYIIEFGGILLYIRKPRAMRVVLKSDSIV